MDLLKILIYPHFMTAEYYKRKVSSKAINPYSINVGLISRKLTTPPSYDDVNLF